MAVSARDVGADYAGGGRRRISLQSSRLTKAWAGGRVLAQMAKSCSNFNRICLTGIKSRLYGFAVLGAAPTMIAHARAAVCYPLRPRKPGGCLTIGLALAGLSHKDPGLTMPSESIVEFAMAHRASKHKLSTARVWQEKLVDLQRQGRWATVHGPIASAAATLLDFGWDASSISEWTDPIGDHSGHRLPGAQLGKHSSRSPRRQISEGAVGSRPGVRRRSGA